MPYITQERRKVLDEAIVNLNSLLLGQPIGDLNYAITRLVDSFVQEVKEDYAAHNAIMGVLESVKQEYYRKRVARYENVKCHENGEVFE